MDANFENLSKEQLINLLKEKEEVISDKNLKILQQEQIISLFKELLNLSRYNTFCSKSEKNFDEDDTPKDKSFDEAENPDNQDDIDDAEEDITVSAHTRKKSKKNKKGNKNGGRNPLPESLLRKVFEFDLSDEEKICKCGACLTRIGQEVKEQLEIIPAQVFVKQLVKFKYACKSCNDNIKTAKLPRTGIPKSLAAPGLLSHVLVSKYEDHIPLNRQERVLNRFGVDIAKSTLNSWVLKSAALLEPLYDLLIKNISTYDIAYADETTVKVLDEPNKESNTKSYMWVFSGGAPDKFGYTFKYSHSREHKTALEVLDGFSGYLHCDGYSAYETVARKTEITLVACWYHARRKFVDVQKANNKKGGVANKYIQYIKKLSAIETSAIKNNLESDKIYELRQEKAKPIIDKLKKDLDEDIKNTPPKSLLGKALNYTLNQFDKLKNYLEDGRLELSNNRTERQIRPFAVGRKNWMFCGSPEGAKAGAIVYSLIQTCKEHKVEPYYYFKYILENIHTINKSPELLEKYLPYNIDTELINF